MPIAAGDWKANLDSGRAAAGQPDPTDDRAVATTAPPEPRAQGQTDRALASQDAERNPTGVHQEERFQRWLNEARLSSRFPVD